MDGQLVLSGSMGAAPGSSNVYGYIVAGGFRRGGTDVAGAACDVLLAVPFGGRLSAAESLALSSNPWQLFEPRRIWVPVSVAGGSTSLTPADALHAHAADPVAITSDTLVAPADALHAHAADSVALTLQVYLTVAEASHTHSAEAPSITLNVAGDITVADSLHAHAADSVPLTLDVHLAVAEASHAHAADAASITTSSGYTTLELIYRILSNRQELNAATGMFTLYDDDGVTVLLSAHAWADAAGTVPYSGGVLARIDALA